MVINKECSRLILRVSPDRIHYLKFILEGYDGLAVVSTVDSKQGIVQLRFPPEVEQDILSLLQNSYSLLNKRRSI